MFPFSFFWGLLGIGGSKKDAAETAQHQCDCGRHGNRKCFRSEPEPSHGGPMCKQLNTCAHVACLQCQGCCSNETRKCASASTNVPSSATELVSNTKTEDVNGAPEETWIALLNDTRKDLEITRSRLEQIIETSCNVKSTSVSTVSPTRPSDEPVNKESTNTPEASPEFSSEVSQEMDDDNEDDDDDYDDSTASGPTPSASTTTAENTTSATIAQDTNSAKTAENPASSTTDSGSAAEESKPDTSTTLHETEIPIHSTHKLSELKGLEPQVKFIREEIIFPWVNQKLFLESGIPAPKSFLIHGSCNFVMTLVMGFANDLTSTYGKKPTRIFTRSPSNIFGKYDDKGVTFIKTMMENAEKCDQDTPCIVLIQDLQTMLHWCNILEYCRGPTDALSEHMERVLMKENTFVIATTDEVRKIPSSLRNTFFGKTLAFPQEPDVALRKFVLKNATDKWKIKPKDETLNVMSNRTDGWSDEDLKELAHLTFQLGLKNIVGDLDLNGCTKCRNNHNSMKVDESVLSSLDPLLEHWEKALETLQDSRNLRLQNGTKKIEPVEVKDAEVNSLDFSSVGGLDEQIKFLRENVIMPIEKQEVLKEWGVEPVRGIIFYGPPGTGKTLLAKSLIGELNLHISKRDKVIGETGATNADAATEPSSTAAAASTDSKPKKYTFFYRKATDCFNCYVGESEKNLRILFADAQEQAPSVIFLDEFDGLCSTRKDNDNKFYAGIITTLLGLMDSVKRGEVLVLAATNRLDSLDPAVRRPGRFDRALGFPMPGQEGRLAILKIHTKGWKNGNTEMVLEKVAEKTVGYSGADLEQLTRQSFVLAMQRMAVSNASTLEILDQDWNTALSTTKSSTVDEAFGSAASNFQNLPQGVSILLKENVNKLEVKLETVLKNIQDMKVAVNRGSGIHSFLISGTRDVDSYLVPLLLSSSRVTTNLAAFTLDVSNLEQMKKGTVTDVLKQALSPPDGKIGVLYVPKLDKFICQTDERQWMNVMKEFIIKGISGLRGHGVLLLATSSVPIRDMQMPEDEISQSVLSLFNDVQGSKSYEYSHPSSDDLRFFFQTNLQDFPDQLEYATTFGLERDISFLLDLNANVEQIMNSFQGEKNKDEIVQKLEKLFKAYATSGSGPKQKQLDMYT